LRTLQTVQHILQQFISDAQVFPFNSHFTGRPKKYSDLNLAAFLPSPLKLRMLRLLRDALENLDLSMCVDIISWSHADAKIKASVLAAGTALLQRGIAMSLCRDE
jgi:hypothetical protein